MQVQASEYKTQSDICYSSRNLSATTKPNHILDFDEYASISSSVFTLSYENFCRICRETEKDEGLFSHCQCKGSVGLAHSSCLLLWIKKSGLVKCELCKQRYSTIARMNKMFWQWKLPRVGTKGWLKFAFFLGFLSMFVTFTTWIIWSRVSSSSEAEQERNKRQVEYTYLVYGMLVLIAVVGMYALNFRPFVSYVSRCIVINQDIVVVPKGEICQDESGMVVEKELRSNKEKPRSSVSIKTSCGHSGNPQDISVHVQDIQNVKYSWNRYAKLQGDGGMGIVHV